MPVIPGTRFGAYDVLALIGSGGMGEAIERATRRTETIVTTSW